MIFSLLKLRKKTSATVAGIFIGATCLWGLSMWQNISLQEILNILLATMVMLGGIIVAALLLITVFKLVVKFASRFSRSDTNDKSEG